MNMTKKRLSTSCNKKTKSRVLTLLPKPFSQTRKSDNPIIINKIVQRGANNQFAGLKEGFSIVMYQVSRDLFVISELIKSITSVKIIDNKNLILFPILFIHLRFNIINFPIINKTNIEFIKIQRTVPVYK